MAKSIMDIMFIVSLLFITIPMEGMTESVRCDHTTPVCECTVTTDKVCEFQMDIEMLQTFTRYEVTANGDSRGTSGRVWYLQNGVWQPTGDPNATPCGANVPIGDPSCSDPFGVDGNTFRSFIAVNGRIPGPTLIVTQNQLVRVNVTNRLASESTSIHWHGMHQRKTNWMDGVEHITQCGILPGTSFTYIFNATQYGTHWYHSHSGAQRTDGLFGALIVREKEEDYNNIKSAIAMATGIQNFEDLPAKHTLSFLDWQKSNSIDLFTQIHSSIRYFDIDEASDLSSPPPKRTYSSDDAEVGPVNYWSGLINGRGSYSNDRTNTNLSIFEVSPDGAYRFRLIGAQSLFAYRVSIDDHKLIVIATDGAYIEPREVDYIIIHSGERYDFLLQTKNESTLQRDGKTNFAIRGMTLEVTNSTTRAPRGDNTAEAILFYKVDVNTTVPSPSEYNSIFGTRVYGLDPDRIRCVNNRCKALNCPFRDFPATYNTDCIHIHQLDSLFATPEGDLPDVETSKVEEVFFNFGFEGARQTSAINGRNLKLPSGAIALLGEDKFNDLMSKEYCRDLNSEVLCDDNSASVVSPDCVCTHVHSITKDRSIRIIISAVGPKPVQKDNFLFAHPIHLHGHYLHVESIEFGDYQDGRLESGNDDIDCGGRRLCVDPTWKKVIQREYSRRTGKVRAKAPLKDTILIPAGGYAVVYFKADNPGWWFLHCHIEVHQLEGMGVIINEGTRSQKNNAPDFMDKCGNFSFTVEQYKAAIAGTSSRMIIGPATVIVGLLFVVVFHTFSFVVY